MGLVSVFAKLGFWGIRQEEEREIDIFVFMLSASKWCIDRAANLHNDRESTVSYTLSHFSRNMFQSLY